MSLVYIFAATKWEARAVERIRSVTWTRGAEDQRTSGTTGRNCVRMFVTGVGPAAARAVAQRMMAALGRRELPLPDAFCVIGASGSLRARLPENAIVTYGACLRERGAPPDGGSRTDCSLALIQRAKAALDAEGIPCEIVAGITSPKVAAARREKLRLAAYGADVVDMESYEILAAASEAGIARLAVRVISDSLDRKIPDFTRAIRPAGDTDTLLATRIALRAPISTLRMIVAQQRALARLSRAMEVVLASHCFDA